MGKITVYKPVVVEERFPVSLINASSFFACANTTFSTSSLIESPVRTGFIDDVHEDGYQVIQPIPYKIERIDDDDFIASTGQLNIATGGDDWQDAYQALVAAILDTFDILTVEANLGDDAAAQFAALKTYLVKAADNA